MDHPTRAVAPTTRAASLRALLARLIDYAGLFPPAGLEMQAAVENYARYRSGEHAWALGRFIVPAARLQEFSAALPSSGGSGPWPVSALLSDKITDELEAIKRFNQAHSQRVTIDTVEVKATSAADIEHIARALGGRCTTFVEIPASAEGAPQPFLAQAARLGLRAKIRTGGLTQETFPSVEQVARFIQACADTRVAFKATAGLHHPLRCVRPFTYEKDSPAGTMHGFLNVFMGAAFALHAVEIDLESLLADQDPANFHFDDEGLRWRAHRLTTAQLEHARTFAIAFGSCSFEEPIQDLQQLGWL